MKTAFSAYAKIVFRVSAAMNMLAILVGYVLLPARTALHFNAHGTADRWGTRLEFIALNVLMVILTYYALEYGAKLALKFPKKLISIPNRDFWLSAEQRPVTESKLTDYFHYFGALNFLFQTLIFVLIIAAHQVKPVRLNTIVMAGSTVGFLVATVFWCVALFRAFKVPSTEKPA